MSTQSDTLTQLLDDLTTRVQDIGQVVITSREGLAVAASAAMGDEDTDILAAAAYGLKIVGAAAADHFEADRLRQIIIEMTGNYLFVVPMGGNGCLTAVTSSTHADLGLVAYEMSSLAERLSVA